MVAAAVASTSKASKTAKAPASHPPFAKMITEAIVALKEKGGSSRQAILKYIKSHYNVDEKIAEVNVRRVLVSATASGKLVRVKGAGASGSFKVAHESLVGISVGEKPKKTSATKSKKSAAKEKKPAAATTAKTAKAVSKPKKTTAKPKKTPTKNVRRKVVTATKKPKVAKPRKPATKKTPKKSAAPKK